MEEMASKAKHHQKQTPSTEKSGNTPTSQNPDLMGGAEPSHLHLQLLSSLLLYFYNFIMLLPLLPWASLGTGHTCCPQSLVSTATAVQVCLL